MRCLLIFAALLAGGVPATAAPANGSERPDSFYVTKAYDPSADAAKLLDFKLTVVKFTGQKLVVVLGANWCHDSAALANLLTSQKFSKMLARDYDILFVDVGHPQTGKGRNLDIAKRFGIKKVTGTPTVMVLSADGKLLNSKKDAASWRNAASRDEDAIYRYFAEFTPA